MPTSANGWEVSTSPPSHALPWITGRVRPGDVATVFDYICRRFNAEVETIRVDWSWGWAYRAVRGQTSGFSNHASGTAIDLNAPAHPLGRRGTFSAGQVAAIRRILAPLDGAVRWGGDYRSRADEMHFEINATAAHLAQVVRNLNQSEEDFDMDADEARKLFREVVRQEVPGLVKAELDAQRNAGTKRSDDQLFKEMYQKITRIEAKVNGK